jgi:hypothetical protein
MFLDMPRLDRRTIAAFAPALILALLPSPLLPASRRLRRFRDSNLLAQRMSTGCTAVPTLTFLPTREY